MESLHVFEGQFLVMWSLLKKSIAIPMAERVSNSDWLINSNEI
jgi:hypothetical protein